MTVEIQTNWVRHQGNNIATKFPYTFRIPEFSMVKVSLQDAASGVIIRDLDPGEYTITGVSQDNYDGGEVTYPLSGPPLSENFYLLLQRIAPFKQELDIENQGGFYPESVEYQLDKLEFQIQQLRTATEGALMVPPGVTPPSVEQLNQWVIDAQEAAEVAQSAAEAAEAAAAGVDLPPVTANTMLVDNPTGTAREAKTFGQVRDLLDPLKDFAADGVTDDTARFTALRAAYPATEFDLNGKTYRVTAIPPGKWRNGFWKVGNFLYSASPLIKRDYFVTNGAKVSNWPQDQAHNDYGVRYVGFGYGDNHATVDNVAKLAQSSNRGNSWEEETLASDPSYSVWCAAMGVLWGRQFRVDRRMDGSNNIISMKMFHRHLLRKYKMAAPFNTTAGSNVVQIVFPENHGLFASVDKITLAGTYVVDGVTLAAGDYTITRVNGNTGSIVGVGNAIAGGSNKPPTGGQVVGVTIKKGTTWTELTFNGGAVDFGTAVKASSGQANLPVTVQSFAGYSNARALLGVAGNGHFGFIDLTNVFSSISPLTYHPFTTTPSRTEPTVCVDAHDTSAQYAYGIARTQSAAYKMMFYWVEKLTTTFNYHESEFPFEISIQNPCPIRYHKKTNTLYAFTAKRLRSNSDGILGVEQLPMYLLVADATEARAQGAAAFKCIELEAKLQSVQMGYFGSTDPVIAIQTGVPSMDIEGDTLIIYVAEEQSRLNSSGVDVQQSNIRALEIDISRRVV